MKLSLIFDFDLTLSPEIMFDALLKGWGEDPRAFWEACTRLQAGEDGFDLEHSYLYRLAEAGRQDPARRLNAAKLREWGRRVRLYPGLADGAEGPGLFHVLRDELGPGQLEIFIISGGLQPVIEGCLGEHGLSSAFDAVFACRMAEEDPGDGLGPRLAFPKETVNFTVKTQKLFAISKGSWRPSGGPHVNDKVKREDLRVPFKNMLYLGDGHSDVAAFALLRQFEGMSFAVHHPGDLEAESRAKAYSVEQQRAHAYFEADYLPGSPLRQAILNWARATAKGEGQQKFGFVLG